MVIFFWGCLQKDLEKPWFPIRKTIFFLWWVFLTFYRRVNQSQMQFWILNAILGPGVLWGFRSDIGPDPSDQWNKCVGLHTANHDGVPDALKIPQNCCLAVVPATQSKSINVVRKIWVHTANICYICSMYGILAYAFLVILGYEKRVAI